MLDYKIKTDKEMKSLVHLYKYNEKPLLTYVDELILNKKFDPVMSIYTYLLTQTNKDITYSIEGLLNLASLYISEAGVHEAKLCYDAVLNRIPKEERSIEGLKSLSQIYVSCGHLYYHHTRQCFKSILSHNTRDLDSIKGLLHLIDLEIKEGNYDAICECCDIILSQYPDYKLNIKNADAVLLRCKACGSYDELYKYMNSIVI